jgi:hypothetical protein
MVVVRAVVHQRLPVDRLEPFHRTKGLHTTVPPIKSRIQVPARVAQIGFEARSIRGPGGEDDPGIGINAGFDEAQRRPVQRVVIGLGCSGDILQGTVVGVGPAVVSTHEAPGVAVIATHYTVAAVSAHVQEGV